MATKKPFILFIEDDDTHRKALVRYLEDEDVSVVAVPRVSDALEAVAKNNFDAIITDLEISGEKTGAPTPLEFMKTMQLAHPEIKLAVRSGIDDDSVVKKITASGIAFIDRCEIPKMMEFISLAKPVKITSPKPTTVLDLELFSRPVLHVSASGKKEMIRLIHQNPENVVMLNALRLGWRPKNQREALQQLQRFKQRPLHEESPIPGSIHDLVDRRVRRNITGLKKVLRRPIR